MPIEKLVVVDRIEVVETGHVQIRTATRIMEDGVQLSESFHRKVVAPGEDYSQEDVKVQAICAAAHTAEVIAAYNASLAQTPQSAT